MLERDTLKDYRQAGLLDTISYLSNSEQVLESTAPTHRFFTQWPASSARFSRADYVSITLFFSLYVRV